MPSATALAIRDKVEALALAWFLAPKSAAAPSWNPKPATDPLWKPVEGKRRKEQTDRKFPRVVFDASRAPEDEAVEGLYRVELQIYLGTSADEKIPGVADIAVAHTQRAGVIEEIFGYGRKDDFLAWVDSADCPVKGIKIYDLFIEEGLGDQNERQWFDQFNYTIVAALRDEP